MNTLLTLQIKTATEEEEKSVKSNTHKPPFCLSAVECPDEEELNEDELDPKVKPKKEKKKKKKKKKKNVVDNGPKVVVENLAVDDLQKLYNRLPDFEKKTEQSPEFVRPETIKPPPKNEEFVEISFPPKDQMKKSMSQNVDDKRFKPTVELLVRSALPTGVVKKLDQKIRINFSHTMFQEEISIEPKKEDLERVHKKIMRMIDVSPALPKKGMWAWESDTMAVFSCDEKDELNGMLIPSNKYTVTVKDGIKSKRGNALKNDYVFSFNTRNLHVKQFCPVNRYPQILTNKPILGVEFNQKVEPKSLFKKMYLSKRNTTEEYVKVELLKKKNVIKRVNEEPFYTFQVGTIIHPMHVFKDSCEIFYIEEETDIPDPENPGKNIIKKIPKVKDFSDNIIFFTPKGRLNGTTNYELFIKENLEPVRGNLKSNSSYHYYMQTMTSLKVTQSTIPSSIYENDEIKWFVRVNNSFNIDLWKKNHKKWVSSKNINNFAYQYDESKKELHFSGKIVRKREECFITLSKKIEDIYMNGFENDLKYKIRILERNFRMASNLENTVQNCYDNVSWTIYFNWNVDKDQFEEYKKKNKLHELIEITPKLRKQELNCFNERIIIHGNPVGYDKFTVKITKKLNCMYETELMEDYKFDIRVREESPLLEAQHKNYMYVLDPTDKRKKNICYTFKARNTKSVRAIVYQVNPTVDYQEAYPMGFYCKQVKNWTKLNQHHKVYDLVGIPKKQIVFEGEIDTSGDLNEKKIVEFNIEKYLQHPSEKLGQLYIIVRPSHSNDISQCIFSWIQVTRSSLDVSFSSNRTLTLVSNSLVDGSFIPDVKYEFVSWPVPHYTQKKENKITERIDERAKDIVIYEYYSSLSKKTGSTEGSGDGVTCYDYGKSELFENKALICMKNGNDVTFLPDVKRVKTEDFPKTRLLSYVFDDKKMFKPKEKIHVKAVLRRLEFPTGVNDATSQNKQKKLQFIKKGTVVKYEIKDSRDVKYKNGDLEVDECSSIYFEADIPPNVNLGDHKIVFTLEDEKLEMENKVFNHSFKVEEFEPPEFLTSCEVHKKDYRIEDKALVTAKATYYSGSGLYNCQVKWDVTQKYHTFNPGSKFSGFNFRIEQNYCGSAIYPGYSNNIFQPKGSYSLFDGTCKTNPSGEHKLLVWARNPKQYQNNNHYQLVKNKNALIEEAKLRLSSVTITILKDGKKVVLPKLNQKCNDVFQPIKVSCKAKITDISQTVLNTGSDFIVHPCDYYIGIKKSVNQLYLDEKMKLEICVIDSQGKFVKDVPVTLQVFRYQELKREIFFKSEDKIYDLEIPIHPEWGTGTYAFVGTIFDDYGYQNIASVNIYANNKRNDLLVEPTLDDIDKKMKKYLKCDPKELNEESIIKSQMKIIVNKDSYDVGETARIVIKTYIWGEGLIFIENYGIVYKKKFKKERGSDDITFEVPITESFVPLCKIHCIVTGLGYRNDINNFKMDGKDNIQGMPAYAKSDKSFNVSDKFYEMEVKLKALEEIYSPGDESKVNIKVNKKGKSVCTLLIVDESVLALTGYKLQFPVSYFYPSNYMKAFDFFLRNKVYVRKWEHSEEKIEEERNKLIKEQEERKKEYDMKMAERLRSIENQKIRELNNKTRIEEENKRRRLYRLKQERDRPKITLPPPQMPSSNFSFGGGGYGRASSGFSFQNFASAPVRKNRAVFSSFSAPKPKMELLKKEAKRSMKKGKKRDKKKKKKKSIINEMKFAEEEESISFDFGADIGTVDDDSFDTPQKEIIEEEIIEDTGDETTPIVMRKMFESTVVFANTVMTDEEGNASVDFKLPDNLTKYSIWCLAEQGENFYGFGESSIIAKLPFNIRPVIPTFLNFGDQIELGFILGNKSEATLKLKCAMRAQDSLLSFGQKGYQVILPKGLRGEVKFKVLAKEVGEGRLQVAASAGRFNDAVEKMIDVYSPSLVSNFVVYGELDSDACHIQQVIPPEEKEVYPNFGGLEIQTSSTIFQQLTDAFLYVYNYQYDCVEQACSRILSIYSMVDIVEEFKLKDVDKKDKIMKVMERSLVKLTETQKPNGGFGFWTMNSSINIYLSTHAAHAVIRVREKYPDLFKGVGLVKKKYQQLLEKCKKFVYSLTSYVPSGYKRLANISVRSFSLYVLAQYNKLGLLNSTEKKKCAKRCNQLFSEYGNVDSQTNECKAWFAFACSEFDCDNKKDKVNALLNSIYKCLKEEKMTAYFNSSVTYDSKFGKLEMLGSTLRENGVILEVLCHINPTDAIIPKLAKHLLKLKKFGKWGNTNENQTVLLGLTTYFRKFENEVPDFVCDMWVKDEYAGEIAFKGRETEFKTLNIPMKKLYITDEEKKHIMEKRKVLEKRSEEVRKKTGELVREANERFEEKFGELFNLMKSKYREEMKELKGGLIEEMGAIESLILEGKKKKTKILKEKKEKKKGGFKLFDFGSKAHGGKKEEKSMDDDDIDFFSNQIDKRQKKPKKVAFDRENESVKEDLDFFTRKIEKNRRKTEIDETHEDEEEKILNSIKNKQIYIMKKGKGRLYYRLKFKYAPRDLKIYAYDFGFNVIRSYHHIEKHEDVKKDISSGMYTFKYGALVRVRVQFTTKERRFHIALCDYVPAGLEPLNPNLKTTGPIPPDSDYKYNRKWDDHRNYRFDRVELFKSEISPGTYYFSYVCRAKYIGTFICLPTKCEEMYNEEINGASNTDFCMIKEMEEEHVESDSESSDSDSSDDE